MTTKIGDHGPCSGCGTHRPKHARWNWVYPDVAPPGRELVPIAVYCPSCAIAAGRAPRGRERS